MPRVACLTLAFDDCSVIEEFDDQEFSGNEFDDMGEHDCVHDGGHLFLTKCGITQCLHCEKIVA
jgi:hypothetical protein